MLKGKWEDHKPLGNAEEGEESFGGLQEGPRQSTGAKWVSAASPSKTSFLPGWKSVLLCHLSPVTCCTPVLPATTLESPGWSLVLPWTGQSRFRFLCSGQTEATSPSQTQPQAERSLQEQPLLVPAPSQKHQHTAVLWHICKAGANQVLTPPAVTGNAKWGADGWAGRRSCNQS